MLDEALTIQTVKRIVAVMILWRSLIVLISHGYKPIISPDNTLEYLLQVIVCIELDSESHFIPNIDTAPLLIQLTPTPRRGLSDLAL